MRPSRFALTSKPFFPVGGGHTPYEAALEEKRRAIRRALKHEFLRMRHHPDLLVKEPRGHIFDPALYRWQAMMNTHYDR